MDTYLGVCKIEQQFKHAPNNIDYIQGETTVFFGGKSAYINAMHRCIGLEMCSSRDWLFWMKFVGFHIDKEMEFLQWFSDIFQQDILLQKQLGSIPVALWLRIIIKNKLIMNVNNLTTIWTITEVNSPDLSEILPLTPEGEEWLQAISAPNSISDCYVLIDKFLEGEKNKDVISVPHFEFSMDPETFYTLFRGELNFHHHTYFTKKIANELLNPAKNIFGVYEQPEIKSSCTDIFAIIDHSATTWDFKEMPIAPNNSAYVQIGRKKGTKFVHRVSNPTRKRVFTKNQMEPPYNWDYYYSCPARDRSGPIDHLWKKEVENGFYFVYIFIPARFVQLPPSKKQTREYTEPSNSKRLKLQGSPQATQPSPPQAPTPHPSPTQFCNSIHTFPPYFDAQSHLSSQPYTPATPISLSSTSSSSPPVSSLCPPSPPLPPPSSSPATPLCPPSLNMGIDPTALYLLQQLKNIQSAQLGVIQLLSQNPQLCQGKVLAELQEMSGNSQTCLSLFHSSNVNQPL